MDNEALEPILRECIPDLDGRPGYWMGSIDGVPLIVMTSELHDRMRILSPVIQSEGLTTPVLLELLSANFDRALDAKYAIWQSQVWATFVHPLTHLSPTECRSAITQVVNLHKNYGSSYASTNLVFRGDEGP